jgi:hypothetical protein
MPKIYGTFRRTETGQIQIAGEDGGTYADFAYARYGGAILTGPSLGSYGLANPDGRGFWTYAVSKHNYLHINGGEAALLAVKAGKDFGPMVSSAGVAACASGIGCAVTPFVTGFGAAWTGVGYAAWMFTDVIGPLSAAIDGNYGPAVESGIVNGLGLAADVAGGTVKEVAPYVGFGYDVGKFLISHTCYGTSCPR